MKHFLCLLVFGVAHLSAFCQSFLWAQSFVGINSIGVYAVAHDNANNVYSMGIFTGTFDADNGLGTYNMTAIGNGNLFLIKEDPQGNFIWAKQISGITNNVYACIGRAVHVDKLGNIYVAGTFRDSFDFDPGPNVYKLSSLGGNHSFVLKLDSNGNFVWVRSFGNHTAISNIQLTSAAFDKVGNIYFTASIGGTATPVPIDVDPGLGICNVTSTAASGNDVIVVKLDSAGNFNWVKQIVGNMDKDAWSIDVDSMSNVYFAGQFIDTVDFDPSAAIFQLVSVPSSSTNGYDVFIEKLDSLGNFLWAKAIGGNVNDIAYGISVDPNCNVHVAGYFQGTVDFDPGAGVSNLTASSRAAFTLKLRNNGDFSWVRMINSPGLDEGRAIATDSIGNVYTTGAFVGTADFDPGSGTYNLTSNGNTDVFIQKLDSSGNFLWAGSFGSANPNNGDLPA